MAQQRNIAVILAGGSGKRLGQNVPKQFLKVKGKTILEYTIDVFETATNIDEIAIVSRKDYIADVQKLIQKNQYRKVRRVLSGGSERSGSTMAAIEAYTCDSDCLLFHDAVRPLVTHRIINDCIDALSHYNAVTTAVSTTDTIVEVSSNGLARCFPPRAILRNVQTPQAFRRSLIKRAYDLALTDPAFQATDDCGIINKYLPDEPIYIVKGETFNIKITYPEDLIILEQTIVARDFKNNQ